MRIATYARVSTTDQSLSAQQLELERWLEVYHPGAEVVLYRDQGYGGGTQDRPAWKELVAVVGRQEVDLVVVAKLDRLGRSAKEALGFADLCKVSEVELVALDVALDTRTPGGRLVLTIMAALAEWERARIRERTVAGLAAAKARGVRLGGRPALEVDPQRVQELKDKGLTDREVAGALGISLSTLKRRRRAWQTTKK